MEQNSLCCDDDDDWQIIENIDEETQMKTQTNNKKYIMYGGKICVKMLYKICSTKTPFMFHNLWIYVLEEVGRDAMFQCFYWYQNRAN